MNDFLFIQPPLSLLTRDNPVSIPLSVVHVLNKKDGAFITVSRVSKEGRTF